MGIVLEVPKNEVPKLIERLAGAEVKILMYLLEKREEILTGFDRPLSMSLTTVYKALGSLKLMDLLTERQSGKERVFTLTENGSWVAKRLLEIDEFIIQKSSRGMAPSS